MKMTVSAAAVLVASTAAHAENFGMQELFIDHPERPINGVVFYPTAERADTKALGNKVWKAHQVAMDADIAPGDYPLVVLSHGMYGSYRNQAWLAKGLVERGYVVAAIDHPGTSTFSRDAAHAQALHERPMDISRTIDALASAPWIADNLSGETFMAGHSLGGWTAVALAGGRFDAGQYHSFCASDQADVACNVLARWEIATTEDRVAALEQDLSDPRISAYAVLDLGGTQTFTLDSLGAIDVPMMVYGAPAGYEEERLNLDVESRALANALPQDRVIYHEPADLTHFDFMGECTRMGHLILRIVEPSDAYVCEGGTGPRAAKHQMVIDQIDGFFRNQAGQS